MLKKKKGKNFQKRKVVLLEKMALIHQGKGKSKTSGKKWKYSLQYIKGILVFGNGILMVDSKACGPG